MEVWLLTMRQRRHSSRSWKGVLNFKRNYKVFRSFLSTDGFISYFHRLYFRISQRYQDAFKVAIQQNSAFLHHSLYIFNTLLSSGKDAVICSCSKDLMMYTTNIPKRKCLDQESLKIVWIFRKNERQQSYILWPSINRVLILQLLQNVYLYK